MKLAVMQPYLFPYTGYFQLICAVDTFVFYDDVNFIKNGWINRNRILIQGKAAYLTVHLKNASSFKPINEIEFNDNRKGLIKTLHQTYKKAPFFDQAISVIEEILRFETIKISDLAIQSVIKCCDYLGVNKKFEISAVHYPESKKLSGADRLIDICHKNGADHYINAKGGMDLYEKSYFKVKGIKLSFIDPVISPYHQNNSEFIPGLSIIDVMMHNSVDRIRAGIENYQLL